MKLLRFGIVAALACVVGLQLGGCATSLSDVCPVVADGSQADIGLGLDRSVAFDMQVDPNAADPKKNVVAVSPIHVEKARGSVVLQESTGGVLNLAGAAAQGATAYREAKGTWKTYNVMSGAVEQHVSGGTYNEHEVYGSVDVNHSGYIYNEVEHHGTVNVNVNRNRPPGGGGPGGGGGRGRGNGR
jgi:hypothetical protein